MLEIIVRNAEGGVLDRAPWGLDGGDLDTLAGQLLGEKIQAEALRACFGDAPTKIYPVLDDDGALWVTIQLCEVQP